MPAPRRRNIIGTAVSIADYEEVLNAIDRAIGARERIYICCAPASTLVFARRDPLLRRALADADVVTPDGMGVVYAARALGEPIHERVYGPDLMAMQCSRAARSGQRVWLYGGSDEGALGKLRDALAAEFPGLEIAGSWSPPFRPLTDPETAEIVARINADNPDIVWAGIGSPKQEAWMRDVRARLEAPVLVGVGAAFDFHAGRIRQAPAWMQTRGLEWLFRAARDPRRLAKRYITTLPLFGVLVLAQCARERLFNRS